MALIAENGPATPYAVRKDFLDSPTPQWSGSAGTIYPLVARMQKKLGHRSDDINIPQAQRRGPAPALASIERAHQGRNRAILVAHDRGRYNYAHIGKHSRFTLLFEAFAIEVLKACSNVQRASALLGLDWQTTHGMRWRCT